MKQYPSRLKFKKNHKIKFSNFILMEQKSFFPLKGQYFLKVVESGKLNFKHIEACRKSVRRTLRKLGLVTIRLFTSISQTKKAVGSRMGKGKGSHSFWSCHVRKGQVVCEVSGEVSELKILKALKSAGTKIPLKTLVSKQIY